MIEKVTRPKKLKVPRKLKALVIDSVRRHAWNIGVSHYTADILWADEDKKKEEDFLFAETEPDRRYLHATFTIYPFAIRRWKERGDSFIENLMAHEVAHLATAHLYHCATCRYVEEGEMDDAWESLTETIGRLSHKLDNALRKQ